MILVICFFFNLLSNSTTTTASSCGLNHKNKLIAQTSLGSVDTTSDHSKSSQRSVYVTATNVG